MTISLNTRNQFKGRIIAINRSDVMSEIEVETAAGVVSAVVTTASVDRALLQVGSSVLTLFKATEVLLAKPGHK